MTEIEVLTQVQFDFVTHDQEEKVKDNLKLQKSYG